MRLRTYRALTHVLYHGEDSEIEVHEKVEDFCPHFRMIIFGVECAGSPEGRDFTVERITRQAAPKVGDCGRIRLRISALDHAEDEEFCRVFIVETLCASRVKEHTVPSFIYEIRDRIVSRHGITRPADKVPNPSLGWPLEKLPSHQTA